MKIKLIIFLMFFNSTAFALPIPEFATAAFGIGEILLAIFGFLCFYLPFLNKVKISKHLLIYLFLFLSLIFNFYFYNLFNESTQLQALDEDRPGMLWTQNERNNDVNAINEIDAYKIQQEQKNNNTNKYVFIDARSNAETQLGTAEGFIKISWADLLENHASNLKDKTVIATCWTGMRGSEVCSKLREKGIDCKYLKEGLQGWVKENLPILLSPNVKKEEFGTAEYFENSEKLLTTQDTVQSFINGATIVDLRNLKNFSKESIQKSINIPFNDLTTREIEYKINTLPPAPVIVACFGIASCSEASLLGWEIHRLGGKYIGAYAGGVNNFNKTLNDYTHPQIQKESIYQIFQNHLTTWIKQKINNIGFNNFFFFSSLILGLLLFYTKQLSIMFFTKNEEHKNKLVAIKNQLNHDSIAISRENQFLIKTKIPHIINSFIPLLLALTYSFVLQLIYVSSKNEKLFSLSNLQNPIGISLLSIGTSALISFSLIKFIKSTKNHFVLFTYFFGLVILTLIFIKNISMISSLFLITSLIILLIIDFIHVSIDFLINHYHFHQYSNGFINLTHAYKFIPEGTKAYKLSYLKSKNFNIPKGFVVRANFISIFNLKTINKILKHITHNFGVRSSALNEDLSHSTHAGLNLSIMPSKANNIINDMNRVFDSYNSNNNNEIVLIQECINPTFSGVMFSQHPQWGGVILIEWGNGLSSHRLDGQENSEQIVVNRLNGNIVYYSKKNDLLFSLIPKLYNLLLDLESIYNEPQDVEWAINNKNILYLLQTRNQTALNQNYDLLEYERKNIIKYNFQNLELCELSETMKNHGRLSSSLVCSLWEVGSSADQASRLALWRWNTSISEQAPYIYCFNTIYQTSRLTLMKPNLLTWNVAKQNFKDNLKTINIESQEILNQNDINLALNLSKLNNNQILNLWTETIHKWKKIQSFAIYFELMAQTSIEQCELKLKKVNIKSDTIFNNSNIIHFYDNSQPYRSIQDYNLSQPRNIELQTDINNLNIDINKSIINNQITLNKSLKINIDFTNELILLRENYKNKTFNIYYLIRLLVLNFQERFNISNEIFEIDINEINNLFSLNLEEIKMILNKRLELSNNLKDKNPPKNITSQSICSLYRKEFKITQNNINKSINSTIGVFVSTAKKISAPILCLDNFKSIDDIEKHLQSSSQYIVYASYLSPQIVSLCHKHHVIGLCSEYGSTLSHPSILAREYNIPFLTKIKIDSTYHLKTITINEDGTWNF